ncbi:MAG TPA: hypothetical protein VK658_26545, partial [Chryseolinea sp.]|nr:hypothetical protein [Chryseolinea sp.]
NGSSVRIILTVADPDSTFAKAIAAALHKCMLSPKNMAGGSGALLIPLVITGRSGRKCETVYSLQSSLRDFNTMTSRHV